MGKFKNWFLEKFFLKHYVSSLRGWDIEDYIYHQGRTPEEIAYLESLLPPGIADIVRPRTREQEEEIIRISKRIAAQVKAGKV